MLFHVQMCFEGQLTIHLQKLHHDCVICFIRCFLTCRWLGILGVYWLLTEHVITCNMKCYLKKVVHWFSWVVDAIKHVQLNMYWGHSHIIMFFFSLFVSVLYSLLCFLSICMFHLNNFLFPIHSHYFVFKPATLVSKPSFNSELYLFPQALLILGLNCFLIFFSFISVLNELWKGRNPHQNSARDTHQTNHSSANQLQGGAEPVPSLCTFSCSVF